MIQRLGKDYLPGSLRTHGVALKGQGLFRGTRLACLNKDVYGDEALKGRGLEFPILNREYREF